MERMAGNRRVASMKGRDPKRHPLTQRDLLAIFDKDEAKAETKLSELCQKLQRFFGWRNVPNASDMVQETMARGFNSLQTGKEITSIDPAHYFMGIARNVAREQWKKRQDDPLDEQNVPEERVPFFGLNPAEQNLYLRECLDQLSKEDFELLQAYTEGTASEWGAERGLQPGALRLRVHRLRKRIDQWVNTRRIRGTKKG
jgi:DNA-directed RNA polymerase specialized sigma24 family protein